MTGEQLLVRFKDENMGTFLPGYGDYDAVFPWLPDRYMDDQGQPNQLVVMGDGMPGCRIRRGTDGKWRWDWTHAYEGREPIAFEHFMAPQIERAYLLRGERFESLDELIGREVTEEDFLQFTKVGLRESDLPTNGHLIWEKVVLDELRSMWEIMDKGHRRRLAEGKDKGRLPFPSTHTQQCGLCGQYMSYLWNGPGTPIEVMSVRAAPVPIRRDEPVRPTAELPANTQCTWDEDKVQTFSFTCKSGRIALANDLRGCHTDMRESGWYLEVGTEHGKYTYMQWYAERGYLTGYVGNTKVWFIPVDGGVDVRTPDHETYEEPEAAEELWERLDETCVHSFHTELWWFCIVDAADLPEDATDSYDRKFGIMEIEPGEYEMSVYPSGTLTASLRRKEDA